MFVFFIYEIIEKNIYTVQKLYILYTTEVSFTVFFEKIYRYFRHGVHIAITIALYVSRVHFTNKYSQVSHQNESLNNYNYKDI